MATIKTTTKSSSKKTTTTKSTTATLKSSQGSFDQYKTKDSELNQRLSESLDGSVRLFGAPHQLLAHNDPRITTSSNSKIGRLYAEKIVLEAPLVCIKPGKSKFMPGTNSSTKKGMLNAIAHYGKDGGAAIEQIIRGETDDAIKYFEHEADFSTYMNHVNSLCRMMAVFLGLESTTVPWAKGNVNFGHYDWRYYSFRSTYGNVSYHGQRNKDGMNIAAFISDAMSNAAASIDTDTEYIQFYVDANASFSESATNSTTSSVIKQFTEQMSSIAKEISAVSDISGIDIDGMASSAVSSMDSYVQQQSQTGLGGFLGRLTGTTKQILQGGNFMVPDIWSDSEYNRSYSFSVTLSTPYGNKLSWYLNIGVPLMFLIALSLPRQLSANTYAAPFYIKATSPGWFNCELGIVESMIIDKGGDASWNMAGMPNEVKVTLSIKDLYSRLALPDPGSPLQFLSNTGMLEFLMVNCGLDITRQSIGTKWDVWGNLFTNKLTSKIQSTPYDTLMSLKSSVNSMGKLFK
jgi:hypothetical protein